MPFQVGTFLLQVLVSLALQVVAYVLMPRPRQDQPEETKELDIPTSEAGKPIPVIFGDVTISSPNIIWWGEKRTSKKEIDGEGK